MKKISFDNPNIFLDIGVGRFPVQTLEEAKIAVDKVINYSATESFGDWRLNICFVGDDNDESELYTHYKLNNLQTIFQQIILS